MSISAKLPPHGSNDAPTPPRVTIWAVTLILTAGALFLLLSIAQIAGYTGSDGVQLMADQIIPEGRVPSATDLEEIKNILPGVIIGQGIATVIFFVFYILTSVFLYKGSNSARIFAVIFTVCSLTGLMMGLWIVSLWVLLNTLGTMLTFAPSSNRYFSAVSTFHKAQYLQEHPDET